MEFFKPTFKKTLLAVIFFLFYSFFFIPIIDARYCPLYANYGKCGNVTITSFQYLNPQLLPRDFYVTDNPISLPFNVTMQDLVKYVSFRFSLTYLSYVVVALILSYILSCISVFSAYKLKRQR